MMETAKIIECPRDAWQGLTKIIPTEAKVAYLRKLILAGFRHLDAVSFVAPKYVPQMADGEQVIAKLQRAAFGIRGSGADSKLGIRNSKLETGNSELETRKSKFETRNSRLETRPNSELRVSSFEPAPESQTPNPEPRPPGLEIIGIVVNQQGLRRALASEGVTTLGYPYSVSANFRRANANMSLSQSRALVHELQRTAQAAARDLVVYVSMAFGNNYDEPWSPEVTADAVSWLDAVGVKTVSLADTVGTAQPNEVAEVFRAARSAAPGVELGVHLHSRPEGAAEKVLAAYEAGCRRFDSALTGLGGCPFAGDDLVGNIPTETVVSTLAERGILTGIEPWALLAAVEATLEIRRQYTEHDAPSTQRPAE
jgi:hydroxymethylglutaryl-CoA lyase